MSIPKVKDVRRLNSFLRGERAAVETYTQCIAKMDEATVVGRLRKLRASHGQRVKLLSRRVLELGGEPAQDSGVWGSFAKAIQSGAKLLGKSAAISTLERGERYGRSEYARELSNLSRPTRGFVQSTLFPKQLRTHRELQRLQDMASR